MKILPHEMPELAVRASNEAKTISMVLKYIALVAIAVCTVAVCALFVKVTLLPDLPYVNNYQTEKNALKKDVSTKVNTNTEKVDQNEGFYIVGLNIEFDNQFTSSEPNKIHPEEVIKSNPKDTNYPPMKLNHQENNHLRTSQTVETKEPIKNKNQKLPENNLPTTTTTVTNVESKNEPEAEIELIPFTGSPLKTIFPLLFNTPNTDKKYTTDKIDEDDLVKMNEPQEIEVEFTVPIQEILPSVVFQEPSLIKSDNNEAGNFALFENKPQLEIEFVSYPKNTMETLSKSEVTLSDKQEKIDNTENSSSNEMEIKSVPLGEFSPPFIINKFLKSHPFFNFYNKNQENLDDKKLENFFRIPKIHDSIGLPPFVPFNHQNFFFTSPPVLPISIGMDEDDLSNIAENFFQPHQIHSEESKIQLNREKPIEEDLNRSNDDDDTNSESGDESDKHEEFTSKIKSISKFYNQAFSNFFDDLF